MSYLAKVAALEASTFRAACGLHGGLPPREELASPAAFRAALAALGEAANTESSLTEVADRLIVTVLLA